jgi:very-short-patch-repair endonuclease
MEQAVHGPASEERIDRRIARFAATRHGLISRSQASALGASRGFIEWRVTTSMWEVIYPGVYRLAGVAPTWRQRLMAACLVAGEGSFASHRSAGALRNLPGMPQGILELSVPRDRRVRRRGIRVHQVGDLSRVDTTIVDTIPTTTVTRTLIDLAAVLPIRIVEEALDDALRRNLTSLSRLRSRTAALGKKGRPGVKAFRSLLHTRMADQAHPQSVLETRVLRAIRGARFPQPVCQHPIRRDGRVIAVVDFAYPSRKLAIEVDGYRWHSSRSRWDRDLIRRNLLVELGWRVIHVTSTAMDDPDRVVRMIGIALQEGPKG